MMKRIKPKSKSEIDLKQLRRRKKAAVARWFDRFAEQLLGGHAMLTSDFTYEETRSIVQGIVAK